jgi:hypothetical protein
MAVSAMIDLTLHQQCVQCKAATSGDPNQRRATTSASSACSASVCICCGAVVRARVCKRWTLTRELLLLLQFALVCGVMRV